MDKKVKAALIIIILLAAFLRLYRLDNIPPALNWDEIAGGYNAYAIANWGRDEWGKFLPIIFTSFRDDKHPVHIYLTAPFVKLFGLSDFTTRLPGALVGILSVITIFYFARIIFKSDLAAFLCASFLAVSPYHMHFSRGLWEANFAPFLFILGLLMFYLAIQKKGWLLNIAFLSFGISLFTYHSSKVVVLPIVFLLIILYFKDLKKLSLNFYTALAIFFIFIFFLFLDPRLLGTARIQQTGFGKEAIEKTYLFQKTKNSYLGFLEITLNQYPLHFSKDYLFISGDQKPGASVKNHGEFYKIDALFLFVGVLYLLKLRSRLTLIILAWLLLAPFPSALVSEAPRAVRAIFMILPMELIAGLGASSILTWFRGRIRLIVMLILFIIVISQVYRYVNYYFSVYPQKDQHEWQYGMKQIVEYVKDHEEYGQVFVTDIRSQPYIFFLFYLKMPLPEFLRNVEYNNSEASKSYNTVSYFGGYYKGNDGKERRVNLYFGGWDPIESIPDKGRLYVIDPSQYDGLRYKAAFDVKKIIYYPGGGVAFYLVSGL